LHYSPDYPGDPKWPEVSDDGLTGTLLKLLEVAELIGSGGYSVYLSSLPPPFAAIYERLNREWKPGLDGKEEDNFLSLKHSTCYFGRSLLRRGRSG